MFEQIHLYRAVSRAEIAVALGLTPAAVSYIVAELLDAGLVFESGRRAGARGQPAIELGISGNAAWTIGLHLDHRKVSGCVANLAGNLMARRHRSLAAGASAAQVLRSLVEVATALLADAGPDEPLGIGLAAVGPLDLEQGAVVETTATRGWCNEPLREPLSQALGIDVSMENNVTAAAIGEYWHGHGRAFKNFLVVGISDGIGGGLFLGQRVYRGAGPNVAEFGHMLVNDPNAPGRIVHLERIASIDALQDALGPCSVAELDSRLSSKDPDLQRWLRDAATAFAQATTSIEHLLDLDAIIMTGRLSERMLAELVAYIKVCREAFYMQGWSRRAELHIARAGADSVMLGAATLPVYDVLVPARHEQEPLRSFANRRAG